ncbi:methanethiol S-methyltransferase [Sphingomonas oryzagri]|uniref:methanethiol S-methyltransferase n=1 Tax=Sphingomonas oryzagri TaxID=3042314 RepID=A0ABT6MXZ4_9SPHN|nr:methanethiol S-methyltransferase [Sphingomonas oryzagri]MDH7637880.1 isoprenylcysteine carboxylmethyltransferase family protein [Sphingomonas oryzagri]
MIRSLHLLFGIVAYAIFLVVFLYLVGFVADLPMLPTTVDRPEPTMPAGVAVMVDVGLILIFGLQHSVMARRGFKRAWTRIVPEPIERSTYMLFACIALVLMFALWQPIPATLWDARGEPLGILLWALCGMGWAIVLLSTFLLNHFELFGLQQVWNALRQRAAVAPQLRQPLFYRVVRHPLYSGFFIAFWATPHMTLGHLLLAIGMSAYMLIAIVYEERDLIALFGAEYEAYRGRVGKLMPRFWRS